MKLQEPFTSTRVNPFISRLAGFCLALALAAAWGGARLFSGWQNSLSGFFISPPPLSSGPVYTLEVGLGGLFWLSPFLFLAAALLYTRLNNTNNTSRSSLPAPAFPVEPASPPGKSRNKKLVLAGSLFLILVIHLAPLLRDSWRVLAADFDEGVHMLAAREMLEGFAVHRDYFFTQPPAAEYGLLPAAALGNGSEATIWLARLTSVFWLVGGVGLVYLCGRRFFNFGGALAALLVFGLDGWGVFLGHQAMLEFQVNFFSLLALWAFLKSREKVGPDPARGWLILVGAAAGTATMTKISGGVLLAALVIFLLANREWRKAALVGVSALLAGLLLALPVALADPAEFVKQVFLFQFMRGPDGTAGLQRFEIFSLTPQANLTLICAWLGTLALFLNLKRGRPFPGSLLLIALWLGLNLTLYTFSRSFYPHYYLTLLPELALFGGGLAQLPGIISRFKKRAGRAAIYTALALILALPLLALLAAYTAVGYEPEPRDLGELVRAQAPPGASLLTLYGLDTFFSERPLAATPDHKVLIDHYGAFYYNVYGLDKLSVPEALGRIFSGYNPGKPAPEQILANLPSQLFLERLNQNAAFTAIGKFGKGYISSTTKAHWLAHSRVLAETPEVWLYANLQP